MSPETRELVDGFWGELFGEESAYDEGRAVVEHGDLLQGYEGIYCVLRRGVAWVSAPPALVGDVTDWAPSPETVMDIRWWSERRPGWRVLGPSVHSFADRTTVTPSREGSAGVRSASQQDLVQLRKEVTNDEWAEGGFGGHDVAKAWVLLDQRGDPCAASNLTSFHGSPADVGVLVAPRSRGHGLATVVAGTAASYAVERCGISRWRALCTNLPSRRIAEKLGFEADCLQLGLKPG